YLSKMCPEVHLLVRRDEMRASKIMQDRVMNTGNIKIHWNTEAEEVLGNGEVTGLRVINNQTKAISELDVKAFFVAIGHTPNTTIFHHQLEMDETAYIITEPKSTHTNVPGVYACGDAQDNKYRQAVTAAGTGAMAALDAEAYLVEK